MDRKDSPADRRRLNSWKEIARYLERDLRTVIRWEHDRGLPVHRVPGEGRAPVFAYADEIDRWLNHERGRGVEGEADRRPGDEPSENAGQMRAGPPPEAPRSFLASPRGAVWLGLVVLGAATAVLVGVLRPARRAEPVTVAFEGQKLVAWDSDGRRLWSDDLGMPLVRDAPGLSPRLTRIADIDSDGAREVLVSVPFAPPMSHVAHQLRCYSAEGRLLWTTQLDDELRFRAGRYGGPWQSTAPAGAGSEIAVYRVDGRTRIAWAQNHHTWWPSVLSVLDGSGRRVARFVHSGVINAVATQERGGTTLVLAGGVSNSRAAAFVAALDGRDPSGSGPEEPGSPFECLDCPPGRPLRYFTLAPSEMVEAAGFPYNQTMKIVVSPDGFEAWTTELDPERALRDVSRFTPGLVLRHASWDSAYDRRHQELEKAGRLGHPLGRCPERGRPPRVREWTPQGGWRDVAPEDVLLAQAVAPR
jgi:hypothetical protein